MPTPNVSEPVYREVAVTDPGVRVLLREYFSMRVHGFPPDQGDYTVNLPAPDAFRPPDGVLLVAAQGGSDVGCGGIRRIPPAPDGHTRWEVKHLFLRETVRGRGLGRAFLAELERRARLAGAEELVLDTNSSLAAAGHLYTRTGFAAIEPYNDNPNADRWYGKTL